MVDSLSVIDGGAKAQYLEVIDTGVPAPDPTVNILRPVHSDPFLAASVGTISDAPWSGTGNANLIAISKAQVGLLNSLGILLSSPLTVVGPATAGQIGALGLATAARQDAQSAVLSSIATNTAASNTLTSNGAVVSNAAPLPVTSQAFYGDAAFNRPGDTAAYLANDVVGYNTGASGAVLTFTNAAIAGKSLMITSASLAIIATSIPAGMSTFVLHLYSAVPASALGDNAPFNMTTAADQDAYLGSITFTPALVGAGILYSAVDGINRQRLMPSANIYGYLVTTGAFTPASGTSIRPRLHTMGL